MLRMEGADRAPARVGLWFCAMSFFFFGRWLVWYRGSLSRWWRTKREGGGGEETFGSWRDRREGMDFTSSSSAIHFQFLPFVEEIMLAHGYASYGSIVCLMHYALRFGSLV